MNKETIQSYNKRLNTNNNSLDNVLENINKLPKIEGTLSITENGTYDVTQYAEVITNIEASGGATLNAVTIEELKTKVSELTSSYTNNACKMHDINEAYVNTPITLYSPLVTHKYYFIRKRSEGYQVVWSPSPYLRVDKGGSSIYMEEMNYEVATQNGVGYFKKDISYSSTSDVGYRGSFYSTVEECIQEMQNPNTSYIKGSSGAWSAIMLEDTIAPCSNCACYWKENGVYVPCPTRRISKDEIIEVIS